MSLGKKLAVLIVGVGVMLLGPIAAANAVTFNMNGSCASLQDKYSYQSAVGYETRLAAWGSGTSDLGCWRVYTAGGETMKVTIRVTNKNLKTGLTSTTKKAFSGVRSVSAYMNTCNHRIKVETWANAGFGQEYLIVSLPVNC